MKTEFELVTAFKQAKDKKTEVKMLFDEASAKYEQLELELIEYMQATNIIKTAEFAELGYVTLVKPQLFANYLIENQEKLFDFLRGIDRADLIKTSVNSKSLSTFIKERMELGGEIPEYISIFLKPSARFYGV